MTDFLDRIGDQLRVAQTRPPRRLRVLRRGWIVGLVVLLVGTPAVAGLRPWEPVLGRPGIDDSPVKTSRSPVLKSAREAVAVLRRPQTEADRWRVKPLLRSITPNVGAVQPDGIRVVADGWALVPTRPANGEPVADYLCLVSRGGSACGPANAVARHGISALRSGPTTGTRIAGIVPDGVARVRFSPRFGEPVEVSVRSNFFSLVVPVTEPLLPQSRNKKGVRGGGMPVRGKTEWLTAAGRVIGPVESRDG